MIRLLANLKLLSTSLLLAGALFCQVAAGQASTYGESSTSQPLYEADGFSFEPLRTDSPRETLNSFIRLTWLLESSLLTYKSDYTREHFQRLRLLSPGFRQLIDLSEISAAARDEVGLDTSIYLLDILGRLDLPPLSEVPTASDFKDGEPAVWRIPGTTLKISRIDSGPREGEFLFSSRTHEVAPWLLERMDNLPLRSTLGIESWVDEVAQLHGPLVPAALVKSLPGPLKKKWLDTPIWKIIAVILLVAFGILVFRLWYRFLYRDFVSERPYSSVLRLFLPLAIIAVTLFIQHEIVYEIFVSGRFSKVIDFSSTVIIYLSSVWAFWLGLMTISEAIILSPKIPAESLDANLLRLVARVTGFVGGVLILAFGAQALGVPVMGVFAGLGVGGLAVALAIRPTLENLIGGAILFIDRPVRVGDYCSFGLQSGTVEHIGVRSTQVRTLDRTLVTIPNANFANMELVNWGKCDTMQIRMTIGLRYETGTDQLRYLLAKMREVAYAHPKIETETVRIRFSGYGESSLNIDFRVYALTRDWNEFYAVQEDLLFRVKDIVAEAGTGFAFPSTTLYMGEDDGLDEDKSEEASSRVKRWRREGRLPFPNPSEDRVTTLSDTLDFPPTGSPGTRWNEEPPSQAAEPLSLEEEPGDEEETKS